MAVRFGMDAEERHARLVAAFAPGVGSALFKTLLDTFGTAREVLAAAGRRTSPRGLPPGLAKALRSSEARACAAAALAWEQAGNGHLVFRDGPGYPPLLAATDGAPPVLFVRGDAALLAGPALAVVGSRRATHYGRAAAEHFAGRLSAAGLTIVSGLALGIDAAAHRSALARGGTTVAVLGTGIDRVYPHAHRALTEAIADTGCLVSEFPLATGPRREHFPRRNRIIAGLCLGVLVVEARRRSGSLITARLAGEAGRDVCAVPGPFHADYSAGCHALIRDGATLVTDPDEVLTELRMPPARPAVSSAAHAADGPTDSENEPCPGGGTSRGCDVRAYGWRPSERALERVLETLGAHARTFDALLAETRLTAAELSSILSALELDGDVVVEDDGSFRRALSLPR